MKNRVLITVTCLHILSRFAQAQGFVNLDFERAQIIITPGLGADASHAIPGWYAYIGTNLQTYILPSTISLSAPSIAIWGPDYPIPGEYHGHYFMVLNPGPFPDGLYVETSIVQTGMIPFGTRSLQFLTSQQFGPGYNVSFAGQSISLYLLGSTWNGRWIWGGDITAFAGQTGGLRFGGGGSLDYIQFSDQPIPEPGSLALFGAGGLALVWRFRRQRP